jgi:hypothetical protein
MAYFEDRIMMRTASSSIVVIGIGTIAKGCAGRPAFDSPL